MIFIIGIKNTGINCNDLLLESALQTLLSYYTVYSQNSSMIWRGKHY